MKTNTRTFLRSFTIMKAKARKGEAIRVEDKEGEYLFTSVSQKKSLLGAAKGKIIFRGDYDFTKPTLPPDAWKASL